MVGRRIDNHNVDLAKFLLAVSDQLVDGLLVRHIRSTDRTWNVEAFEFLPCLVGSLGIVVVIQQDLGAGLAKGLGDFFTQTGGAASDKCDVIVK